MILVGISGHVVGVVLMRNDIGRMDVETLDSEEF